MCECYNIAYIAIVAVVFLQRGGGGHARSLSSCVMLIPLSLTSRAMHDLGGKEAGLLYTGAQVTEKLSISLPPHRNATAWWNDGSVNGRILDRLL